MISGVSHNTGEAVNNCRPVVVEKENTSKMVFSLPKNTVGDILTVPKQQSAIVRSTTTKTATALCSSSMTSCSSSFNATSISTYSSHSRNSFDGSTDTGSRRSIENLVEIEGPTRGGTVFSYSPQFIQWGFQDNDLFHCVAVSFCLPSGLVVEKNLMKMFIFQ
jgi:hypothetical protein